MNRIFHRPAAMTPTVVAVAVAMATFFAAGKAAAVDDPVVDEVVVSVFRTTGPESLPASITVLDADEIRRSSVQHFEELIARVPNLNYSGDGNRARYFQLRGIGELEQYQGAPNPSVGFIIDDIDLSGLGSAATLFDVDQIDVLRGPQGARYGASALAGLIFVRSAEPEDAVAAGIEATAGSDDTTALGGMLTGPISDTAAYRLAVQHYDSDGNRRNRYLGRDDTNGQDETTARGKLRWQLGDGWQFDLTGLYADIDNGYDAWSVDNHKQATVSDKPGRDVQETAAGSLRVTGHFGEVATFVAITSLARTDSWFSFDADWGNDAFWNTPQYGFAIYDYFSATKRARDTDSQEFRLVSGPDGRLFGRVDWLVGAYGLNLDERIDVIDTGRDDFWCILPCVTPFASAFDSRSRALFAELGMPLGGAWRIDVGARWERWEADYADGAVTFGPDDNLWGGHVNVSWQAADTTMLYARAARGYKAGGFNLDANAPPDRVPYRSETLWNAELGIKYLAADRRLRADLVTFWMERDDMQVKVPVQDTAGNPIAFSFLTANARRGRNLGVEAAVDWRFAEQWAVHGSLGLLDADIERFDYVRDLEGRGQAHAPAYTFMVGATWEHALGWFVRADITGSDAFYFDYSHDQKSRATERANLRFGRSWNAWSVEFWGQNIFDETYSVRGFYFGNEPPAYPDRLYTQAGNPRRVGVTLKRFF